MQTIRKYREVHQNCKLNESVKSGPFFLEDGKEWFVSFCPKGFAVQFLGPASKGNSKVFVSDTNTPHHNVSHNCKRWEKCSFDSGLITGQGKVEP